MAASNNFNLTQCAINARSAFLEMPNNSFLVQQDGSYTGNLSDAWGIRYEACNRLCGARGSWEPFDWAFFSSSFSSWLLPYLALTAQLPFETKDAPSNFMVLCLAIGSPMLLTYSLTLTILNTRWINYACRQLKETNEQVGGKQIEAIEAARRCLIESQHVPAQVYQGPERELAHLIVLPQNIVWWMDLEKELRKTRRPWTYSLVAQLFWVFFSQLLAFIDFITTASVNSIIGMGLAINSVWIWMIPVVFGWVCIGTQTAAGTFKAALMTINPPDISERSRLQGRCAGFRDHTGFSVTFWKDHDEEASSGLSTTLSTVTTAIQYEQKDNGTDILSENVAQGVEKSQEASSQMKQAFLGLTTRGCECEPGPMFNFARFWTFTATAAYVLNGFRELNSKLACNHPQAVSGEPWNYENWESNFQGSPERLSRYISSSHTNFDRDFLPVHSAKAPVSVLGFSLLATLAAALLQWATTGGAILIAYLTPTIGLGCESGVYVVYGAASTLSFICMIFASYLSHLWSARLEQNPMLPAGSLFHLVGPLAVATRCLGKYVAVVNAGWVVITSTLQFTKLFNNCWCESVVAQLGTTYGWVAVFASDAQIAAASSAAWDGGLAISLTAVLLFILFILFGRGAEVNG